MVDISGVPMFIWRTIVLVGILVMFIILTNSFSGEINVISAQKFAGDSANMIMESDLTTSRGVFDMEKIKALDGSEDEPVRPCEMAARYEFYLLNESAAGKNWTFGFGQDIFPRLKNPIYKAADTEKYIAYNDYSVWIRNGDALMPAMMRVYAFNFELFKVTCAAENALERVRFETKFSCQKFLEGYDAMFGGKAPSPLGRDLTGKAQSCEIFQDNDKMCVKVSMGMTDYTLCRKSSAEVTGRTMIKNAGTHTKDTELVTIAAEKTSTDPNEKKVEIRIIW